MTTIVTDYWQWYGFPIQANPRPLVWNGSLTIQDWTGSEQPISRLILALVVAPDKLVAQGYNTSATQNRLCALQ